MTEASPSQLLRRLLRGQYRRLALAIVLAVAAASAELWPYWLLGTAAGVAVTSPGASSELFRLAGWLALALLFKYLLYSAAYYCSHVSAFQVLLDTRRQLVRQLAGAPLRWLNQAGSGELKRLVLQDVDRLEQFIAHHTVELAAALASPVLVAGLLLAIDWRLALAALATVPFALLLQAMMMRGFGVHMAQYGTALDELHGATIEYVRSMPVMKAYRQDATSFQRMRDSLHAYQALMSRITRQTVPAWSVFMVLLSANIATLLPAGLWLYQAAHVTLPQLVLALVLGSGMLKPLFKVIKLSTELCEVQASLQRMASLPAPVPAAQQAPACLPDLPDVRFEHVFFAYANAPVLHDVSLHLPAGSLTALVGPSGAGKSTVAALLAGLLQADAGRIRIGGVALDALDEGARTALIALATQDAFLFRGSLLDNLRLGRPDASDAQVRQALRVAQADGCIDALPAGWHTHVEERGVRLSGGERQRIAIARALLADTPILLLDEATAFADNRTERRFYQALRAAYPHKTVLVIAHRLSSIAGAAQILVMDQGRLVARGAHADLLPRCPLYHDLWQRQFDSEQWHITEKKTHADH
ncbi:ABC transporter ATP-binding protein [Janthinobacterium sp. SUN026]|uniref:ABC transporter ATP-binding protein n=1 Tax=Janthinobacterium sp. SUN026 TaxID=3002438 RepID=UPI0025B13CE6|nr:ABC transporter ATP-binding protein [Janthinobacterium sp. SUN026]MDN2672171.1 ABC transporter ATP-binding protein [Janthinobacterium sp. SUN026]